MKLILIMVEKLQPRENLQGHNILMWTASKTRSTLVILKNF